MLSCFFCTVFIVIPLDVIGIVFPEIFCSISLQKYLIARIRRKLFKFPSIRVNLYLTLRLRNMRSGRVIYENLFDRM